jgi:hypothetical protein
LAKFRATDTVKAAEFAGGFTPIIHAPALNMENYEKDFALENLLLRIVFI